MAKDKNICSWKRCKLLKANGQIYCSKHGHQVQKEKNPINYCYNLLKSNARRRKKDFSLTLDQFKIFVSESDYMALKGKTKKCLSIDRVDNNRGYHFDNIKAVTISANITKYHNVDRHRSPPKPGDDNFVPF